MKKCTPKCAQSLGCAVGAITLLFITISVITAVVQRNQAYNIDTNTDWVLLGGLTSTGIDVRIRIPAGQTTTLVVKAASDDGESNVVLESEFTAPEGDPLYVQSVAVDGIQPNSSYDYEITRAGVSRSSGTFRTPSPQGEPFEFSFATAGCSMTGSEATIFTDIFDHSPLFMAHLGDFHYEDIGSNNPRLRVEAVDTVLGSSVQRQLWSSTPLAYTWDDHDWLGNNSDENEEEEGARETALQSYQWMFPHYPLQALGEDRPQASAALTEVVPVPVYHAFTIGTVRFLVTDLRSESNPDRMYSDEQRNWLFTELQQADAYDFVVLFTSKPWIGEAEVGEDNWMGAANDRTDLSNLLSSLPSRNVLAISSDAHMLGFDSGRNTYYGDDITKDEEDDSLFSFPILNSGPLDRLGSTKGGPFTYGCNAINLERNNQFSVVSFKVAAEGEDQTSPCLGIRSYSGKTLFLEKEICGQIYAAVPNDGSKEGTCDSKALSSTSLALGSVSIATTAILGGLLLWQQPCRSSLALGAILWFGLIATYVVGFAIPSTGDYPYSLAGTSVIALVQTLTVSLAILYSLYRM